MDLLVLLKFAPLVAGLALISFLLFNKNSLATFSLGKLFSYFFGVIITFIVVGWFVDFFVFSWINARVENADNSPQFVELKDRTENIFDEAFNTDNTAITTNVDAGSGSGGEVTTITVIVTPTPESMFALEDAPRDGPVQYTVVANDTLFGIATRYNTTVNDIMVANGLTSNIIQPGQVLTIPAPSN
jgi:hypothetical protein